MILSEGKVKLVKTGKILDNFNSCFGEYINNTNYMYILADNEEEVKDWVIIKCDNLA